MLSKLTNVLLIAVCLAVIGQIVYSHVAGRTAPLPQQAASNMVKVGDVLKAPLPAAPVIALAIASRCHFCVDSMPFYRQVAATPAVKSGRVKLMAFTYEPEETLRAFLKTQGLGDMPISNEGWKASGASGTPTIFRLDAAHKVEKVWNGKMRDVKAEQDFLAGLA